MDTPSPLPVPARRLRRLALCAFGASALHLAPQNSKQIYAYGIEAFRTSSEHLFCPVVRSPMSWPLSHHANKNSGLCSICRATRLLHLKDGTVHKHGPRDNPCPGSHKPPLSKSQNLTGPSGQSQPPVLPTGSQLSPPAHSCYNNRQSVSWSPASLPLIKHIPKSARPACASNLAKLLRGVTA